MGRLYFEYKEPVEEKPIQDTPKPIDNKTITKTNKVSQNKPKQPKKKKWWLVMASKKDNYINRDFSHDRDRFDSNITL